MLVVCSAAMLLATALATHAADSLTTVPLIGRAPVIDGAIDAKEWSGATVLQPLVNGPNSMTDGFRTRVSLAWTPDMLFVAIQHQRPPQAPMVTGSKAKDQLVLTLTAPNRKMVKLFAWAGAVQLEPQSTDAAPSWQQAGTLDTYSWATEILLPLNRLCTRNELLASGLRLDVELREPSIGAEAQTLSQSLRFVQRQLAFRFLNAGEFEGGANQGCMIELINCDELPANLSMQTAVSPKAGNGSRYESGKLILPGDSLRRIRLASPSARGDYRVTYNLSVDGAPFASGEFGFQGNGPMHTELIPFHLWRGGIFVRSTLPGETNAVTYRCELREPNGKKELAHTEATGIGSVFTEQFVDTSALQPSPYSIKVTATRDGSLLAERTLTFIRPVYPKWWRPHR